MKAKAVYDDGSDKLYRNKGWESLSLREMAIYEKVKIKHDMTRKKEGREQASNIYKTVGTSAPLLITMTAPQWYSTYPKRLNGRRRTLAIHREKAPAAEEPRPGIAIGK